MASADDRRQSPPSFAPAAGRRRPDDSNASVVGDHTDESHSTRVMPAAMQPQSRSPRRATGPSVSRDQAPGGLSREPSRQAPPQLSPVAVMDPPSGGNGSGNDGDFGDGPRRPKPRRRKRKVVAVIAVLVLILLIAWPVGLAIWANGQIQHVDALSNREGSDATTYLLAGSDSRADTSPESSVEGARTDTILLLTVPKSGPTSLISIPRDTYAEIPGHGAGKVNAAYSYGGPELLVRTVEGIIDAKVDHYVEIGFAGIKDLVNAVGGVRLCLDYDVDDELSKLKWKKGCRTVGGKKALAFSRMRYADPKGDIGRAERQRQVIGAIMTEMKDPSILVKPGRQVDLIKAGTSSVVVDENANILTLGNLALAFRNANGEGGVRGTPPIADLNYRPGGVGSTVLLDPKEAPQFFNDLRAGNIEPGEVGGID